MMVLKPAELHPHAETSLAGLCRGCNEPLNPVDERAGECGACEYGLLPLGRYRTAPVAMQDEMRHRAERRQGERRGV